MARTNECMASRVQQSVKRKMTTGALLYAFNSEIEYTKIAIECAKRIKKHLSIPVTLITDEHLGDLVFEREIILHKPTNSNFKHWQDTNTTTKWYNEGRSRALELTPYDRTLLVDIDYMVNSNVIKSLLQSTQPFFAHKTVQPIEKNCTSVEKFGKRQIPMWWATVVIFDKSQFTKDVFAMWQMVEQNYQHYANVFEFDARKFRNDFALSIALLVANGNTIPKDCNIPWPLVNVDPAIKVTLEEDKWWIDNKFYSRSQDLHIMGKSYLENLYAL